MVLKQIGTLWDRMTRNTINENFKEADDKITEQKDRVNRIVQENPQPSEVVDARGGFPVLLDRLNATDSQMARSTQIKGTTQIPTFNENGTIQKLQHKDGMGTMLREDVFTYGDNLVTEVRTLTSGETLTFKYYLDTYHTEVL